MPKFNRNFVTLIDWGEMKGTPPVLNLETDLTAPLPPPRHPAHPTSRPSRPSRDVCVRLRNAIFDGCVVCDHDNGIGEKGSQEWHNYNIQHRHMTHRESRAAAHLHGGLNAWWALNPNR